MGQWAEARKVSRRGASCTGRELTTVAVAWFGRGGTPLNCITCESQACASPQPWRVAAHGNHAFEKTGGKSCVRHGGGTARAPQEP